MGDKFELRFTEITFQDRVPFRALPSIWINLVALIGVMNLSSVYSYNCPHDIRIQFLIVTSYLYGD